MTLLPPFSTRTGPDHQNDAIVRFTEELVIREARRRQRRRHLVNAGIGFVVIGGILFGLFIVGRRHGSSAPRVASPPLRPATVPAATPIGLGYGCAGLDQQQIAYVKWHPTNYGLQVSLAGMVGAPLVATGSRSGNSISFSVFNRPFVGTLEGGKLLLKEESDVLVLNSAQTRTMSCVLESFAWWKLGVPMAFADQVRAAVTGYQTCKQLQIPPRVLPGPPGVPPAATAIAHGAITADLDRTLSIPEIELVESDGPAACGSTQFGSGTVQYVIMSPSLTQTQAAVLQNEEIGYLYRTHLLRTVVVYPATAEPSR